LQRIAGVKGFRVAGRASERAVLTGFAIAGERGGAREGAQIRALQPVDSFAVEGQLGQELFLHEANLL
jgi:hypothetical protein